LTIATAGLVAGCGAPDRPRVLGVSIVATTTTTPPPPTAPTPLPAVAVTPPTPAPPPPTAVTVATSTSSPAPATTTSEPPGPVMAAVAGESTAAGTYVEPTDRANSYSVAPDGTTKASSIEITRRDAPERADVVVMYFGATVEVQLTNLVGRTMVLPGGYTAAVECRRDGQPWQSATAVHRDVTSVEPGATVSATVDLPADGPGTYDCAATIEIVLP
jgi:hypothetical protein